MRVRRWWWTTIQWSCAGEQAYPAQAWGLAMQAWLTGPGLQSSSCLYIRFIGQALHWLGCLLPLPTAFFFIQQKLTFFSIVPQVISSHISINWETKHVAAMQYVCMCPYMYLCMFRRLCVCMWMCKCPLRTESLKEREHERLLEKFQDLQKQKELYPGKQLSRKARASLGWLWDEVGAQAGSRG